MSLSQKHSGLILVPWFNSKEWKHVYNLVYSEDKESQIQALDYLKLWKLRTPILSVGVEGTLILLEAHLLDTNLLSNEQISNLYAIAIVRFLNLSAANSDKQGSFSKVSTKNELPKWLISLRHDIAHGHQVPSIDSLKMAINFGFAWLKEKYWQPQSKLIKDFCIEEESAAVSQFSQFLSAYVEINVALFENKDVDKDYFGNIKALIKSFNRNVTGPYDMLDILLSIMKQNIAAEGGLYVEKLLSAEGLLNAKYLELTNEEGKQQINKEFRDIWHNLLNLFHQNGLLFIIVGKLYDIIGNIAYSDTFKQMSSLWIKELFDSLQNTKDSKQLEDTLKLESNQYTYNEQSLDFQNKTLDLPSEYSILFLESVLNYNSNLVDNKFQEDVAGLVEAKSFKNVVHQAVGEIYTLDSLKIDDLVIEDENAGFNNSNLSQVVRATSKWRKIEDTSMFNSCPLGVLPHQIEQKHPFLVLS